MDDNEEMQRSIEEFLRREAENAANDSTQTPSRLTASVNITRSPEILPESPLNPARRMRVSDINVKRYIDEFLELEQIGDGFFGNVKIARHRLDGVVYAIKMTKGEIQGTAQERAIMNEIFAHAALEKHRHIVRYYNSWVENGHIYIQNEYCKIGTLANAIKIRRQEGKPFTESELRKIVTHIAKGLQ